MLRQSSVFCCYQEMLNSDRDLIAPAAGFDEAIRRCRAHQPFSPSTYLLSFLLIDVCHVVSITFQRVAVDHLAAILGDLQGEEWFG